VNRCDVRIIYANDIPQGIGALYIREINAIIVASNTSKLEQLKALKKITDRLNFGNKEFIRSANAEML